MSKTGTKKSDARQRMVETAEQLFYAEGVRAVGIDRIIAEAGVAKMTLYNHFPSKDDLILAVVEFREAKFDAMFEKWMGRHVKAGMGRLDAFFAALKKLVQKPRISWLHVHQHLCRVGRRRAPRFEVLGRPQAAIPCDAEGDYR